MSARNQRQRFLTASQLNSRPPSLRKTQGVRKVKHNWSMCCATSSAFLVGIGNAKESLEALSTASEMYSLSAKEVVPIRSRSTSNTSHGSTARAEGGLVAGCYFAFVFYSRRKGHIRVHLLLLWASESVPLLEQGWMLSIHPRQREGQKAWGR